MMADWSQENGNELLFQGLLKPKSELVVERWQAEVFQRKVKGLGSLQEETLPIISIGKPISWTVQDFFKPDRLPGALKSRLDDEDMYIIRMSCSFRPKEEQLAIAWARFTVSLLPNRGHQVTAYDLFPLHVTQTMEKKVKVSLTPTLNFSSIGASLGEMTHEIEYQEIRPVVYASGAGESNPAWDYLESKGYPIYGSKYMYLVLAVPKKFTPIVATITMVGRIRYYGSFLDALLSFFEEDGKLTSEKMVTLVGA
jgi:hypothetical protein